MPYIIPTGDDLVRFCPFIPNYIYGNVGYGIMESKRSMGRISDAFWRHPIMWTVVLGAFVRVVLGCFFTFSFDSEYWGLIDENLQSGAGLYELPGMYYTPVWGYFLSFIYAVAHLVFGVASIGVQADSLVVLEGMVAGNYTDIVVSVEFAMSIKMALMLVDLAVSYVLYRIVMTRTGNERYAVIVFALWFLCPLTILSSSVKIMFDSVSALLLLLAVYLVMDGRNYMAGGAFCIAVMTKFFPAYVIFLLVAYLYNRDRTAFIRSLSQAVIGAFVMLGLILLPDIIQGNVDVAFGFLTNRIGSVSDAADSFVDTLSSSGYTVVMLLQPLVFAIQFYLAYRMAKYDGCDRDGRFLKLMALSTLAVFLWTPTPVYLLVPLPFLMVLAVVYERRYLRPLMFLIVSATVYELVILNVSTLLQLDVYYGLVSSEYIISVAEWFNDMFFMEFSNFMALSILAGFFLTIAIYLILFIFFKDEYESRRASHA